MLKEGLVVSGMLERLLRVTPSLPPSPPPRRVYTTKREMRAAYEALSYYALSYTTKREMRPAWG